MTAEERNINITLIFSLSRYRQVIEAYRPGLEDYARRQRPLWATSTRKPSSSDTHYVDNLIGPHTVNTLPKSTIAAFEDHGTIARTIDVDIGEGSSVLDTPARIGLDMDETKAGARARR
jgi:transaldolase